jgi:hypothetical protein
MRSRLIVGIGVVAVWVACGGGETHNSNIIPSVDAGPDAGPDGGRPDSGPDAGPDAGQDAGPDGGSDAGPDGGTDAGIITFPSADGWTFYGPQHGGPTDVFDVAMDEGGNLWVAGGTEGLFLLRNGATKLEKFGIADGLHPYGYLNGAVARYFGVPDGTPADKDPSLNATPVISVAGGPAGTVFVGYQGKQNPANPRLDCESAWTWDHNPGNPSEWGDPAIYKSGDADRVTLTASGISVVHYDIFSGPDVINAERGGREKLCTIYRIVWDKAQNKVWFGGNHGFAMGIADYPGNPTCNGQWNTEPNCAGLWEHAHPAVQGCAENTDQWGGCSRPIWMTDLYFGIGLTPGGDVWMGGNNRTTVFHYGSYGGNNNSKGLGAWYKAGNDTEGPFMAPGWCTAHNPNGAQYNGFTCGTDNRLDIWKDYKPECTPTATAATDGSCKVNALGPSDRKNDAVSGIVADATGAWVSSFAWGLVHVDAWGNTNADPTAKLLAKNVSSLALDPSDGSLWAGMSWGMGISRYDPATGNVTQYSTATFGDKLVNAPVSNIQAWGSGATRKMLVGFRTNAGLAGAVGVFTGN